MRFELSRTKHRCEILAAPELLRINAVGMSERAKFLFGTLLTLLYVTFLIGAYRVNSSSSEKTSYFLFLSIFTAIYLPTMKQIFTKKVVSLVFTTIGIADTGLFAVKYEDLGGYKWASCDTFCANSSMKKADKTTLFLTANKGLLKEVRFVTRFGTPALASYGFFFDDNQVKCTEEILNRFGINKLPESAE